MQRLPLNLKQEDLTRSALRLLEQHTLVTEAGGGYGSMAPISADQIPPSGDPIDDEKVRQYMMKRQRETEVNRNRRIDRLRKLARMDFKLVGGVAPVGFFGGSGGSDAGTRSTSIGPRT